MSKPLYILLVLFLGLLSIFLQGTVFRIMLPDFLVPNLTLSIVAFLAFYDNTALGVFLAFFLGIEFDMYSGNPVLIGPSAGSLVLIYGLLASLSQRIYVESPVAIGLISIVCALLHTLIYSLLIFEFNEAPALYFSSIIINALVTGCFTPLIFRILTALFRVRGNLLSGGQGLGGRSRSSNV